MAVNKTRNNGTMTESQFWSFIRSILRQKSRYWKPIQQVKQDARRPYKGENKRQKWEYKCSICSKYFSDKEIEIDHTIPAGSLTCGKDLEGFIERLFVEKESLTCMCKSCHLKKTNLERQHKKKSEN